MKKTLSTLALSVAIALAASTTASALTITAMDSAENLAQSLVGSGITISNVTYTGANVASGYFSGGTAAGIGIDEGIVLTTGFASNLDGTTNTDANLYSHNLAAGSAFLGDLIGGPSTYDAAILQFDFISSGDAAYFTYVFGSEEYNEWVGDSYNDVFGFFLNGTAVTDNVALIPGTDVPVAINNVNKTSYSDYYNNNDAGEFAFEYDGFTDVLVASMTGLNAGQEYTLTLGITDVKDAYWDSGVFLGVASFSNTNPAAPVPEPATMLLFGTGLAGLVGYRKRQNNG